MKLQPRAVEIVQSFYKILFELNPTVRPLFSGDIELQERKLMEALNLLINGLHHFELLKPDLQLLGRQHASYGLTPEDYTSFEVALMACLAEALADEFTPAVESAWREAYHVLTAEMISRHEVTSQQVRVTAA